VHSYLCIARAFSAPLSSEWKSEKARKRETGEMRRRSCSEIRRNREAGQEIMTS